MVRKILIVDDSAMVRRNVRQALEPTDFTVMEAHDGADGLAKIDAHPDLVLVICDVNMPGMNGVEMVEALHAAGGLSVPVVMLTTDGRPALMVRAKAAGVKGWIVKPFKPAMLRAEVQRIVGAAGS